MYFLHFIHRKSHRWGKVRPVSNWVITSVRVWVTHIACKMKFLLLMFYLLKITNCFAFLFAFCRSIASSCTLLEVVFLSDETMEWTPVVANDRSEAWLELELHSNWSAKELLDIYAFINKLSSEIIKGHHFESTVRHTMLSQNARF